MSTDAPTLRQVIALLEEWYPHDTAQSWDRVGLVTGHPDQAVQRVLLAVDPTIGVTREAVSNGADLVITHHPLLLRGVHTVAPTTAKGTVISELVVGDVALYCAHTNADVATAGVGEALAAACGLGETLPLVVTEGQELGRVGDLPAPITLRAFTQALAAALPSAPVGVRVAGEPDATVKRIAVLGGAGDGELEAARAAGADVYVTADLRHHPALEAREETRATDGTGRPFLVDAGHWASEWLWLPVLAERLRAAFGGLEVDVSTLRSDPWDFVVHATDASTGENSTVARPEGAS